MPVIGARFTSIQSITPVLFKIQACMECYFSQLPVISQAMQISTWLAQVVVYGITGSWTFAYLPLGYSVCDFYYLILHKYVRAVCPFHSEGSGIPRGGAHLMVACPHFHNWKEEQQGIVLHVFYISLPQPPLKLDAPISYLAFLACH